MVLSLWLVWKKVSSLTHSSLAKWPSLHNYQSENNCRIFSRSANWLFDTFFCCNYSNAPMTCLVINKKNAFHRHLLRQNQNPSQRKRDKEENSKVLCPVCQIYSQCAPSQNCFCLLCHRFGRKKVFFLTVALHALATLLQAAAVNLIMFGILNLFRGYSHNFSVSHILGKESGTLTWLFFPTSSSKIALMFPNRVWAAR